MEILTYKALIVASGTSKEIPKTSKLLLTNFSNTDSATITNERGSFPLLAGESMTINAPFPNLNAPITVQASSSGGVRVIYYD